MTYAQPGRFFLIVLLLGAGVLSFLILKPFLYALVLAIIFATVFYPIHARIARKFRTLSGFSALLSTLVVIAFVVIPVSFIATQVFQESTGLYGSLVANGGVEEISRAVNTAVARMSAGIPVPYDLSVDVGGYATKSLEWLAGHFVAIFTGLAHVVFSLFIFLIAIFFLFKDGSRLRYAVVALSPLPNSYDEMVLAKLAVAVNSVVRGSLAIALVQGIVSAIGFTIFGVPSPALWGSVAAIAALVPSVGTSLVVVPAALFLFVTTGTIQAVGLLLWGMLAVGLVDNLLGPKLVERGVRIHPFLILLSILGGIAFFGPLGFLLGPLVLSLLFALLEIYSAISADPRS